MCPSCGRTTYLAHCQFCGRVALAAVYPHARTFGVAALGIAASVAVIVATVAGVAALLVPLVVDAAVESVGARPSADLDATVGLLALAYGAFLLVAWILVASWLYRARRNLDAFPGSAAKVRPGWAFGAWFVPIVNLVYPCRLMLGLVRDTRRGGGWLVAVWWTAWLAFAIGERLPAADRPVFVVLLAAALVVAGVSLVVLIARVSRTQEDRIAIGAPTQAYGVAGLPVPPLYVPGATIGR